MSDNDLLKRLRYLSRVFRKYDVEYLTLDDYLSVQLYPDEAANRIEALTAERDALREELEELDFLRHEGGPDSVAAMEAELKRLRAVLSDIKTASVCSVSRHVAASALGEAAE